MRVSFGELIVDVIDYEIVRIGEDDRMRPLGDFRDAHFSSRPRWRLVAGYLMLSEETGGSLTIHSHGHAVARAAVSPERITMETVPAAAGWRATAAGLRGPGIGILPSSSTICDMSDSSTLVIRRGKAWSVSIVHGPADAKIDNRLELLTSLESVGGRHG